MGNDGDVVTGLGVRGCPGDVGDLDVVGGSPTVLPCDRNLLPIHAGGICCKHTACDGNTHDKAAHL